MPRTVRMTERELTREIRKAFKAGRASARADVDVLLDRMYKLKTLNGSTGLFRAEVAKAFQESDHPREHGKFSEKQGESGGGDDKPDDPAPAPTREGRQAARDERRASATAAREHHFQNAPHHAAGPDALAKHHAETREHLVSAGATDKELAEYDRRAGKAHAKVSAAHERKEKAGAKVVAAKAAADEHDAKREALEAAEPPEFEPEYDPEEPDEPDEPDTPFFDLDTPPSRDDYETDEDHAADTADWEKDKAAHAEWREKHKAWEKAHAAWEKETAAVQARNEKGEAAHDKARDAWEKAVERHDERADALTEKADAADEAAGEAEGDYEDAHAGALDHVHEHVDKTEDAVHARLDDEEAADPEPEEEEESEEEGDDPPVGKSVRKHAWSESQHARDHGKFAPKGGGQSGQGADKADSPPPSGSPPATQPLTAIPDEHLLSGLHAEVPPGLWEQVAGRVRKAAQAVHERLVLATPAFLKLQHLLTSIESPDDLKQLGYTPLAGPLAGHETPDALRASTGIPGTLGAKLVSHVLARVLHWMKKGHSVDSAVGKALAEFGIGKAWDESKHKRDHGKFSSAGGSSAPDPDDGFGDVRPPSATGEEVPLPGHFPTARTPRLAGHGPEVLDPLFAAAEAGGHVHRVKLADLTNPGDANGVPHQDSVDAGVVAEYQKNPPGKPIQVIFDDDGTLSLWDGRHRAVAAKLRGEESVEAVIVTGGKGGAPRFVPKPVGKAFDPGEKRDESGKWSNSGGGSKAPAPKVSKVSPPLSPGLPWGVRFKDNVVVRIDPAGKSPPNSSKFGKVEPGEHHVAAAVAEVARRAAGTSGAPRRPFDNTNSAIKGTLYTGADADHGDSFLDNTYLTPDPEVAARYGAHVRAVQVDAAKVFRPSTLADVAEATGIPAAPDSANVFDELDRPNVRAALVARGWHAARFTDVAPGSDGNDTHDATLVFDGGRLRRKA